MDKKALVEAISSKFKISKKDAAEKIKEYNMITEIAIKETVVSDKTKIGDYVVVEKKEIPARMYRNITTGEAFEVAAHVATKIKHTSVVKKC